jgi:hypothetical protein
MARTPSSSEIAAILVGHGIVDFVSGGRLTKIERNLLWKILKKGLPMAATPAVSLARSAIPLATNPYLAGTALGLGALQTQPGQQLLEMAEDRGRMDRIRLEQLMTDIEVGVGKKVKRTKSKFNSAVSKGMKAIKNSTSYGKKGIINAPKKAFKAVVGMAAKLNKGVKPGHRMPVRPKTKTLKVIYNSMIGLFR